MVSVLMAVHPAQSPQHLAEALDSLARQTLPAAEVVLVCDGSLPPELDAVIASAAARLPLRTVRWANNRGLGAALREGLEACTFPLVARLDSDDVALSHRLERQLRHLRETGADVCGSFALCRREDGRIVSVRPVPTTHDRILDTLWACPFIHGSVMFRRDAILAVGSYDATLRRRQDYDLWFRCGEAGLRFANVDEPLIIYRLGTAQPRRRRIEQALVQARVGVRHAKRLGMPRWKQLACYYPLVRAWVPDMISAPIEAVAAAIDPRRRA